MKAEVEKLVLRILRACPIDWNKVTVIPVLHVEKLHDDRSYASVVEFCDDYLRETGCRALATVIPPVAPILMEELAQAGYSEDSYAERIRALASRADIGLHGHYLRGSEQSHGPVHNYWNERLVVEKQMTRDMLWLETKGFMSRRAYSAGWWYLDDMVRAELVKNLFEFDFSPSRNRYNLSLRTNRGVKAGADRRDGLPREHLAVCRVSNVRGGVSAVPRHIAIAFWKDLLVRRGVVASLYSHDWDLDPAKARVTLRALGSLGVRFEQLSSL